MPSRSQARVKVSETNTFPPSMTMVSGTITGLAAASSIRVSMSTSRACGSRDADIRSAAAQPGRIGSGTSIRASSSAASTALVPTGRSTAAQIVRVATSTAIGQVRAHRHPVVQQHHHVQRRRVDLHLLARPGGERRGEHAGRPVGRLPAGHRRAERVPPGRQRVDQLVERGPARQRHHARPVGAPPPP